MISDKISEALNKQLNKELESAYIYYSMAAHFANGPFDGMAKWIFVHAQEEMTHAMRIYNHILQRGNKITLHPIAAPKQEWGSPLELFQEALAHENTVTRSICDIASMADQDNDQMTNIFLHWFVSEQQEEEDLFSRVIDKIKLVQDSSHGLYLLDREMAARTFNEAAPEATSLVT